MCERGQRGVMLPSANGAAAPLRLPAPRRVVSLRSITCVPAWVPSWSRDDGAKPALMAPHRLRTRVPAPSASLPSSLPRGRPGRASSRRGLLIRAGVCQRSAPLPVLVLVLAQRRAPAALLGGAGGRSPCRLQHRRHGTSCPRLGQSSTTTSPGGDRGFRQQEDIPQPHGLGRMRPCHAKELERGSCSGCSDAPVPSPAPGSGREGGGSRLSRLGHQTARVPPLRGAAGTSRRSKELAFACRWGRRPPRGAAGAERPPDRAHLEPAPAHLCCGWEDGSPPGPSRAGPYLNCPHALWSVQELMLRRPGAICQCSNGRLLLMNNITAPFPERLPASGSRDTRPQPP